MSRQPSQPLRPWIWLGVPMALSAIATVVLAAPLRVFGMALPEPVFPMALAFAWAVIRPSVMGPFALLLIGLFNDLFWGGPIGLWPVSLLAAYFAVMLTRSLMAGQSTRVLWFWYAVVSLFAFAIAYLVSTFRADNPPSLASTAWQLGVTVALYPLAHWLIDRFEDADVRFR